MEKKPSQKQSVKKSVKKVAAKAKAPTNKTPAPAPKGPVKKKISELNFSECMDAIGKLSESNGAIQLQMQQIQNEMKTLQAEHQNNLALLQQVKQRMKELNDGVDRNTNS